MLSCAWNSHFLRARSKFKMAQPENGGPPAFLPFNSAKAEECSLKISPEETETLVLEPLEALDMDAAFAGWSRLAERTLLAGVAGEVVHPHHRVWQGRGQDTRPVWKNFSPPRFHCGRPTDFQLDYPSVSLVARRWQKFVRRLQALCRLLRASPPTGYQQRLVSLQQVNCIWAAIQRSLIRPTFGAWAKECLGFEVVCLPRLDTLEVLLQKASAHAQQVGKDHWNHRRQIFADQVETSWSKGGSLPFRLLRDQSLPTVVEMESAQP